MSPREGQARAREPLDETDVERAIADEDAVPPTDVLEGLAPAEPGMAAPADAPTTEELEEELENRTPAAEEQMLHTDDATTEALEDERDVSEDDVVGDAGDELEWRMDEQQEQDEALGGGASAQAP